MRALWMIRCGALPPVKRRAICIIYGMVHFHSLSSDFRPLSTDNYSRPLPTSVFALILSQAYHLKLSDPPS
ncbi:hypothetical protein BU24DRAFT_174336 [Aaosphaeria arxii CBS 175.79]|uniref:Uncharacterized protein n=1 Tax=Aaosphaeria arxii CBS 175.79 TaxID=1450172 RepID=A0A6A5XPR4_9PLEO|nr:uncharacterized protein BU24DRAFT_174336 [Aaosphaeria arxii CBS 175.79]KAF2015238.1 hypothetical protein BU24DRAFT_174336 [Aaosphaeria arxii CBS 175.79]